MELIPQTSAVSKEYINKALFHTFLHYAKNRIYFESIQHNPASADSH